MKKTVLCIIIILSFWGCKTMPHYKELNEVNTLSQYQDQQVTFMGKISEVPWQHLIGFFKDYPYEYYFDIGKDYNEYQIVIYTNEPELVTNQVYRVYGKVVKVEGKGKRPDSDEDFSEYHLLVEKIE